MSEYDQTRVEEYQQYWRQIERHDGSGFSIADWLTAALRGDATLILEFLAQGMDVNASLGSETALMIAVRLSQLDVIKILLDHGADMMIEDSLGNSALTQALILAEFSHQYGRWRYPNPNDPRPLALLRAAGGEFGLREAVMLNDVKLAQRLLEHGADPNTGERQYHGPMLMEAARDGKRQLVELLLDFGAKIDAFDDISQTALIEAAAHGQTDVVQLLLDRGAGADIDIEWELDWALSRAATNGHQSTCGILENRGARRCLFNALSFQRNTKLFQKWLEDSEEFGADLDALRGDYNGQRLLISAIASRFVDAVRILLDRGVALVHESDEKAPLACAAVYCDDDEMIKFLFDRGADLHQTGTDGITPLQWAEDTCKYRGVEVLRSLGAER